MIGGSLPVLVEGDQPSNKMGSIAGTHGGAGAQKLVCFPLQGHMQRAISRIWNEE